MRPDGRARHRPTGRPFAFNQTDKKRAPRWGGAQSGIRNDALWWQPVRAASLIWINHQSADFGLCADMASNEHRPGDRAPHSGEYEELNVLGSPTGWSIYAEQGAVLPSLPRGFTWRHVPGRTVHGAAR